MEITVSIPDKFVPAADPNDDISRRMLEAFAIESYRQEELSLGQLAELLGLSIDEANAFLREHDVPLNGDINDFEEDALAVELFLKK